MICIKTEIPKELNYIDDELKAIYHSKDTVCFYIFKTREFKDYKCNSILDLFSKPLQNYEFKILWSIICAPAHHIDTVTRRHSF